METAKEKLLYETYDRFVQTGMNIIPPGEIDTFVDTNIMGYGTTLDEKIISASGFLELVERQKEQGKDVKMEFDIAPVLRRILADENTAVFVDEITISMLINDECYKMFLRFSSVLEYRENKWLVVHWHGSKPEYEEGGADTWHIDEHKAKTEKLEKEVAEKTSELLTKNRELEIEASLERVRAIALSMNKPDDMLEICKTISAQLESLGVTEIRNVQTAIVYESKGTYLNYEYYRLHNKTIITEVDYHSHPKQAEFAYQMLQSAGAYFTAKFEGDELKKWLDHQKKTSQFIDSYLETAPSVNYYFYSLGPVALGISNYSPLSEDDLELFKRFRNVFELAYRRFLDIEKAEAQAREAQIEASLERVRSLALGLRNSDEVGNVTDGFFSEFNKLTLKLIGCSIVVIDEEKDLMELWRARSNVAVKPFDRSSFKRSMEILKKNKPDWFPKFYGSLNERKNYLVEEMSGKRRTQFLNSIAEQYYYSEAEKSKLLEGIPQKIAAHFIFFKLGYLVLLTEQKLPDENLAIARRFVDLFDFAYTRFLDIKKAEEQAREAQVELALEHIRAQVTAMRESTDLLDIVVMMQSEFIKLGHEAHYFWHMRWLPDKYEKALTNGEGTRIGNVLELPRGFHGLKTMLDWEKTNEPSGVFALDPETAADYIDKMIRLGRFQEIDHSAPGPDEVRAMGGLTFVMARTTHGEIGYTLPGEVPNPPEEDIATLVRFAGVFDLAYRRFEDLQSAERRNRETLIELALERVRARAMAMQKSTELADLVATLFYQLNQLDFALTRCYIFIIDPDSYSLTAWTANTESGEMPASYSIKYLEIPFYKTMINAWQEKKQKIVYELGGEEKIETDRFLFEETDYRLLPESVKSGMMSANRVFLSFAFNTYGALQTGGLEPLSEEKLDILSRFAQVFDQNYTRFLDLQKAEAQTREAQIEAALERVRARAMAMHNSEDLAVTVDEFFKALKRLEVTPRRCGVTLINEKTHVADLTVTSALESGEDKKMTAKLTLTGHPILEEVYAHWKKQQEYHPVIRGAEIKDYYESMNPEIAYPDFPDAIQYGHYFYFKEGGVFAWTDKQISDEDLTIYRRFTSVLSLTYRRYLDLVEAEAQARESEIQLALERVRARTMAMHKSDELAETAAILFQQMTELGVTPERLNICLIKEENKLLEVWATDQEGTKISHHFNASLDEPTTGKRVYDAWKEKKKSIVIDLTGKELNDWIRYVREVMGMTIRAELVREHRIHSVAFFSQGMILTTTPEPLPEESIKLLERFADVFNLTYRRFLDLQNAEAQAREAQIETSLEKVRSRSLAMHKSDELQEVVNVVFERLIALNIDMNVASIFIFKQGSKDWEQWVASADTNYSNHFHLPYTDNLIFNDLEDAKKSGKDFYNITYSKKQKNDWFHYAFINTEYSRIPEARKKFLIESEFYNVAFALSKNTGLQLAKYSGGNFSDKDKDILKRFSKVFEQAYIRFMDLQKAEAQTREAQIEASLERVRAKAMAMHSSKDLADTIGVFYSELKSLGVIPRRCGVALVEKETRLAEVSTMNTTEEGDSVEVIGKIKMTGHPILENIFDHWLKQKEYHTVLRGNQIKKYYQVLRPQISYPDYPHDAVQFGYYFMFKEGDVYAWTEKELIEEELKIFRRFTTVVSLTYKRYKDLQQAEAQAREAQIEAALERVRAKTMAMHKSDELAETAAVVFQQLMNLGIEPNRIYIGIINNDKGKAEFWITDEDGSKISTVFKTNLNDNPSFKKMYDGWKEQKKSITIDMHGKELQEYLKYLNTLDVPFKGGLSQKRRMQYIVYFTQGFIGVASPDETKPETLQLLERFAAVFNLTYTRFHDLMKAEAQNKIIQVENDRKSKELEEARHMQLSMLPKEIPQFKNLEIAVHMQTATEVGGDYYDFTTKKDGSINVALGDATGHGMKAGIMVSSMKSIFTTNSPKMDIEEFFQTANNGVKSMNLKRMMIGFTMLNIYDHSYKLMNAGMPPVFFYCAKSRSVQEVQEHGVPVGAMNNVEFKSITGSLDKGDVILLLTDGLPELKNEKNEMYGYKQIRDKFKIIAQEEPKDIIDYLKNETSGWSADREPEDDITFLALKCK